MSGLLKQFLCWKQLESHSNRRKSCSCNHYKVRALRVTNEGSNCARFCCSILESGSPATTGCWKKCALLVRKKSNCVSLNRVSESEFLGVNTKVLYHNEVPQFCLISESHVDVVHCLGVLAQHTQCFVTGCFSTLLKKFCVFRILLERKHLAHSGISTGRLCFQTNGYDGHTPLVSFLHNMEVSILRERKCGVVREKLWKPSLGTDR